MSDQHNSIDYVPSVTRKSWEATETRIYIQFLLNDDYQYVTVSEFQAKGMLEQLAKLFPSAVLHQENTDAFRIPSGETAIPTIDDNSKSPYIYHVKKTRARQ